MTASRATVPLGKLAAEIAHGSWFAALGEKFSDAERDEFSAWLGALGFECAIAPARDWAEAARIARSPDWDRRWWQAEEAERARLLAEAGAGRGERRLLAALSAVTQAASDTHLGAASIAAARAGVADPALARAAAGAATQACYLGALALAAGRGAEHPFALKLRLFESGRWPLGIVGGTAYMF